MTYPSQGPAIDIWSAGVTMLCLVVGRFPLFEAPNDEVTKPFPLPPFTHRRTGAQARKPCMAARAGKTLCPTLAQHGLGDGVTRR
jgi:serine/threonine protein kinase